MVKGRACADGRPQCIWTDRHDAVSTTIAVEALLYTLIMDSLEKIDVATCDLPGYFLQINMEGAILLQIDGALASLLVKIDWKPWKRHLRHKGKNPVIYVKCDKAVYRTITAALL